MIGREIVEHLQEGDVRAIRGEALIEELSVRLGARFGRGFSTTNLRYFRTFFLAYRDREPKVCEALGEAASMVQTGAKRAKRQIGSGVLRKQELPALSGPLEGFSPVLGWTHYQLLMKVEHEAARRFYEIEADQAGWSAKHLERQIDEECFYIDLVFYNIVLKCHVLIDLKLDRLTHQDVGQMDGDVLLVAPLRQHAAQPAVAQRLGGVELRHEREAQPVARRDHEVVPAVGPQRPSTATAIPQRRRRWHRPSRRPRLRSQHRFSRNSRIFHHNLI